MSRGPLYKVLTSGVFLHSIYLSHKQTTSSLGLDGRLSRSGWPASSALALADAFTLSHATAD